VEHAVAVQVVEGQEQLREPAAHPLFGEEDASRLLDPLRPAKNFDVIEIEKTYW
jgi:hypothetical protein